MSYDFKKEEQEIKKSIQEEAVRDYLLGKDLSDIEKDLNFNKKVSELGIDVNEILERVKEESGEVYIKPEINEQNQKIIDYQVSDLIKESIEKIEKEEDPEVVINNTEEKLSKLGLGKEEIEQTISKIFKYFDMPDKKPDQKDEVVLEQSGEKIPLPKLDLDYDELEEVNLKTNEELIPGIDRKTVTTKDNLISEKYGEDPKTEEEYEKYEEKTEPLLSYNGQLVEDTRLFTDFIKQTKVCVVTTPYAVRKLDMESFIFKYLNTQDEGRFTRIFVFGWEQQANYKDYKSFNELVEINQGFEGALFIIRDIKTFNVFAVDILRGVLRNYFMILLDSIVTGEDLAVVENLSNSMSYLYPSDIELKVKTDVDRIISNITRNSHLLEYRNKISNAYKKPEQGFKESHDSMMEQEDVRRIGRNILNVDLSGIESLTNPGCTFDECLRRSPKFSSMITSILTNSESRMLIKFDPGRFGLDAFSYTYSLMKKPVLKAYIIKSSESFESKKIELSKIPERGPCLILTDYSLGDVLTPKNIDKFFIAGGGEYLDIQNTVMSLVKSVNYTKDDYPRKLEITCFITQIQNDLIETVDVIDYREFKKVFEVMQKNNRKLRSHSLKLYIKGAMLYVNKQKVEGN